MRVQATFTCRRFSDGTTALTCRETGTVYTFNDERHPYESTPIWAGDTLLAYRRGRAPILAFIESDARWQLREWLREQKEADRRGKTIVFI